MTDLPAPLTPADLDLSALEYMPLHVERLKRSVAWIKAKRNPELGFYLINLWTAAYMQTPAASLPDDDDLLCDAAMCEPKRWPKVKEAAMRGFILCSDGRWYHRFVADIAHDALEKRLKWRKKKQTQRGGSGGDGGEKQPPVPSNVPPVVPGDIEGDRGGVGALRDGTGRDNKMEEVDAGARAAEPPPDAEPMPAFLRRDARGRCLAIVERHFPDVRNDLRAYPGLTGSLGLVDSWIGDGADLDRDVLPVIEATCLRLKGRNDKPRSFALFTQNVANAKTRNSAPLPESNHGQRASPSAERPLSAGQRTVVELAAILGADLGGPAPGGEPEPGVVVDAAAATVSR